MSGTPDRGPAARAVPGRDRLELVRILTREQAFIVAYAFAIVRDHHLAEDVYQEVALLLAEAWDTIPSQAPRPWLKEVVRRKALEAARRARRHVLLSPDTLLILAGAFAGPDASDDAHGDDDALRVAMAACVQKLPEEVRTIIDGRYREGLSCEVIADRIGRTVQAVYATLKRARTALAGCVERAIPGLPRERSHE